MPKQVYFAGSIRGGRVDADLYQRIIAYIQRTCTVLTEHVGHQNLEEEEKDQTDADIFEQDVTWLACCDLVIAECTCPSLGVGYELGRAESLGKPVHVLYNSDGTQLSAMLAGNAAFSIHPYQSEEQIYPILDSIL